MITLVLKESEEEEEKKEWGRRRKRMKEKLEKDNIIFFLEGRHFHPFLRKISIFVGLRQFDRKTLDCKLLKK